MLNILIKQTNTRLRNLPKISAQKLSYSQLYRQIINLLMET